MRLAEFKLETWLNPKDPIAEYNLGASCVKALRLGEASVVGNVEYTQLVYAIILGFLLFNEVPDIYTIIGAAIIVGSSIYIFHRQTLLNAK